MHNNVFFRVGGAADRQGRARDARALGAGRVSTGTTTG